MKLTESNYYGREASIEFMSCSQFKAFQKCEAAALAEVYGDFIRPATTALLVGQYVDTKLDGPEAFEAFQTEHPEIFKKAGTPKSDFVKAEEVYQRIQRDELMKMLLSGQHQVILTGEIAGVKFRGKMDSLLSEEQCREIMKRFSQTADVLGGIFTAGAIVDGKVMKDFAPVWNAEIGLKQRWIDAWGYDLQGAIYQHLEGHNLPFIIAAATKETEPDISALAIPQAELDAALRIVEENAPRYAAIKRGEIEPVGCGCCDFCKSRKKLSSIPSYLEV